MFSDFSVMAITTLFLDIGGVLLTNGWDGPTRALAAKTFGLDLKELDNRHHLTFETFERVGLHSLNISIELFFTRNAPLLVINLRSLCLISQSLILKCLS